MARVLQLTMESGVIEWEVFVHVWPVVVKCCPNGVEILVESTSLPLPSVDLCNKVVDVILSHWESLGNYVTSWKPCTSFGALLAVLLMRRDYVAEAIYVAQKLNIMSLYDLSEIVMAHGKIEVYQRVSELLPDIHEREELWRRLRWYRKISHVSDELYLSLKTWEHDSVEPRPRVYDGSIFEVYLRGLKKFLWNAIRDRSKVAVDYIWEKLRAWPDDTREQFYSQTLDVLYQHEASRWGYDKAIEIVGQFY